MKFRTEIDISKSDLEINHQSKMLIIGSCFANNIGQKMIDNKFDSCLNPFGVLYNPVSIRQAIDVLIQNRKFTEEDIFIDKGIYNSFAHHSSFSSANKDECLAKINASLDQASERLRDVDILFITFGTAYVYEYIKTQEIVGNCHKVPSTDFTRYRLSVESIVNAWDVVLNQLERINPSVRIVFTVSPIRHLRDGAHDNQLSKSTLLLAIDELAQRFKNIYYFPSYEILLDDLRDYRFYDQDMVHPNALAVEYIWDIFQHNYFSKDTKSILTEWRRLRKAIGHKPFNASVEEHILFLKQTLLKIEDFGDKYPFICLTRELRTVKEQIALNTKSNL